MITGLSLKEVSSREESAVNKEGNLASLFRAADPMSVPMLTTRFEEHEPYKLKVRCVQNTVYWLDPTIVQDKRLEF